MKWSNTFLTFLFVLFSFGGTAKSVIAFGDDKIADNIQLYQHYVGIYQIDRENTVNIFIMRGRLFINIIGKDELVLLKENQHDFFERVYLLGRVGAVELLPENDQDYLFHEVDAKIHFVTRDDGYAIELVVYKNNSEIHASRVLESTNNHGISPENNRASPPDYASYPGIKAPNVNVSGIWTITSFTNVAPTCDFLQVGNALSGFCKGPYAEGDIVGIVDGSDVKWIYHWINFRLKAPGYFVFNARLGPSVKLDDLQGNLGISSSMEGSLTLMEDGSGLFKATRLQDCLRASLVDSISVVDGATIAFTMHNGTIMVNKLEDSPLLRSDESIVFEKKEEEICSYISHFRQAGSKIYVLGSFSQDVDLTKAYIASGKNHLDKGKIDAAISDFTAAISLAPHSAESRALRAVAYASGGDREHADLDILAAIAINPSDPNIVAAQALIQGK